MCGGSSPLARGLPGTITPEQYEERIIPARAGFTQQPAQEGDRPEDHPRSRGVYELSRRCGRPTPGSSPLARGLQIREIEERIKRRIIPARAGFTGGEPPFDDADADHPRSRGVYSSPPPPPPPPPSPGTGRGSSPLARGLPQVHRLGSRDGGIIPARAGFTPSPASDGRWRWDHPRSRGVYC